jgi:dGTPase
MVQYSNFSTDYKLSKGRMYKEDEDFNRTCFMRDRDRVIHSTAFRRLKYKTQVFVYHEKDYFRTRLSHSIEVSQLARSISKVFNVNDDLSEAISLAHDLGHTPFGHAGEDVLNKKMEIIGGFNHNFQAIKILTLLEKKYLNFDGLNLSFETLDGILKHNGPINCQLPDYINSVLEFFDANKTNYGSFESQIAAICDDIAYNNNDIDDGLYAGLFDIDQISEIPIVDKVINSIKFPNNDKKRFNYEVVRGLIKLMVDDLIVNTKENIKKNKINSYNQILNLNQNIVCFSDHIVGQELKLRNFLKKNMYEHARVKRMTIKAKKIITDLFELFIDEPSLLPPEWRNFDNHDQKLTKVCDYISGMTDKYAINMHKKFFDLYNL